MKKYHMGVALKILDGAEKEFICKTVANSHLGPMGAEITETWCRSDGVIMRIIYSNGGCTLEIDE